MRQPLPKGTKIEGYGEEAEVVFDEGLNTLLVKVVRIEQWHYSWRGNDIKVVEEEPKMKEEFYGSKEYFQLFERGQEWLQYGVK